MSAGDQAHLPACHPGPPGVIVPSLTEGLCRWSSASDLGSRTCGGVFHVVMLLAWIPGTFLAGLPPGDCGGAGDRDNSIFLDKGRYIRPQQPEVV